MRFKPTRIVALGGGKGGVGRSTIAVALARALARSDQKVLLVDFDGHSRALAALLELDEEGTSGKSRRLTRGLLASSRPNLLADVVTKSGLGLLVLHGVEEASDVTGPDLARWLRQAEADWVVLDLPSRFAQVWCSTFLNADVPLLVALAEPVGLSAATRYVRACLRAAVAHHPETHPEREALLARMHPDTFWDWDNLVVDARSGELLEEVCIHLNVGLVLNQVRESNEAEQAHALAHAWGLSTGIWPRVMPSVCYEDRKWFFARRLAPPPTHPREESVMGAATTLARALVSLDWMSWTGPRPCLASMDVMEMPKIFLDLPELGSVGDLRQRYRRLWEGYRRENGLVSAVMSSAKRNEAMASLDEAFRKVQAASAEAEHSQSGMLPVVSVPTHVGSSAPGRAQATTVAAGRIHPGQIVRTARLKAGLGLRELSLRTRVGVRHLEAIETMRVPELPDRLYLKAYLSEIARPLGLEPEALVDEYMSAMVAFTGPGES